MKQQCQSQHGETSEVKCITQNDGIKQILHYISLTQTIPRHVRFEVAQYATHELFV